MDANHAMSNVKITELPSSRTNFAKDAIATRSRTTRPPRQTAQGSVIDVRAAFGSGLLVVSWLRSALSSTCAGSAESLNLVTSVPFGGGLGPTWTDPAELL
jgi:hypothetical protein